MPFDGAEWDEKDDKNQYNISELSDLQLSGCSTQLEAYTPLGRQVTRKSYSESVYQLVNSN